MSGQTAESDVVDCAAVVVTHNSARDLPGLLASLPAAVSGLRTRTIVVDTASSDRTVEIARSHAELRCVALDRNVGYAAAINIGRAHTRPYSRLLVLNADVRLQAGSVGVLSDALRDPRVGIAVPMLLDPAGRRSNSLRREPSLGRGLGDAIFGSHLRWRPGWLSEVVWRDADYTSPRRVDWATGAVQLISGACDEAVGAWEESFFLYSEEIEYSARARRAGYAVQYVPEARACHLEGGSGRNAELAALMAVNRVRYYTSCHPSWSAALFRWTVVLNELLRSRESSHRPALRALLAATRRKRDGKIADGNPGMTPCVAGSVLIPAHNEERVIARCLELLVQGFERGELDVVVVCNGCDDETAAVARRVPYPIKVIEIERASKPAALRVGEAHARAFPRIYLDADIHLEGSAARRVLCRLRGGRVLAARPPIRYDARNATGVVRSYYRARTRMPAVMSSLWGAGVYALSEEGRARFGRFPDVVADDLYVDSQFGREEIEIVDCAPAVVTVPQCAASLVTSLRRCYRGNAEHRRCGRPSTRPHHALWRDIARSVAIGPSAALDATTYLTLAVVGRLMWKLLPKPHWERDDSSRTA